MMPSGLPINRIIEHVDCEVAAHGAAGHALRVQLVELLDRELVLRDAEERTAGVCGAGVHDEVERSAYEQRHEPRGGPDDLVEGRGVHPARVLRDGGVADGAAEAERHDERGRQRQEARPL